MMIDQILKCKCSLDLFSEEPIEAQQQYLKLMLQFHPDRCNDPRAAEVSAAINTLYDRLRRSPKLHTQTFRSRGGDPISVQYWLEQPHEYGIAYYGQGEFFDWIHADSAECFVHSPMLRTGFLPLHLPYEIKKQAKHFVPQVISYTELSDGILVRSELPVNEIPLAEAVTFYGGKLDCRQAAWIISRLLDICCYASFCDFVWNCLLEENLLIDPQQHTVRVGSGWWFAAETGTKLSGVQPDVYDCMPLSARTGGLSDPITDLECVKAICRRIFPHDAPASILRFAESACASDAVSEMERWDQALIEGFGERRFCPWQLRLHDLLGS